MAQRNIGTYVTVTGGMPEFVGKVGRITEIDWSNGRSNPALYRVAFSLPIVVPGVGRVWSDLWEGRFLKTVRG